MPLEHGHLLPILKEKGSHMKKRAPSLLLALLALAGVVVAIDRK